ncbi:HAD-IA family hydrolase [Shewanella loihica]|uniref:HAD-superfamily hydrolase, subfamily IA, variant 1 n=1 Tax=Shewanella loihica (strain ATCC BAA-1088 / PV-4) TaxID=323850 RepID=A3Q9Q0_SHELP|nr:HAD-superfamily hydrolase, subfamily IA, variant 1 [Shewanella loihica PV-4]
MVSVAIGLRPFKAISFDLDDTLYDNRPIIMAAEQRLLSFLAQRHPLTQAWSLDDWQVLKRSLIRQSPSLAHDTSAARLVTLEQGLITLGYAKTQAGEAAQQALAYFVEQRSDFTVAPEVIAKLTRLARHYPLIGITNGNVDAQRIGLGEVLEFVLHPGNGTRMKPYPDMFYQACQRLDIGCHELLHLGDSFKADVQGARRAGCQAAWLNPAVGREPQLISEGQLPHMTCSDLDDLLALID